MTDVASPDLPFRVLVYDKTMARLGTIGAPETMLAVPRHLEQPTASLTLPMDAPRASDLMTAGARVVIKDADGNHLIGGPIRWVGLEWAGTQTPMGRFEIADDYRLLFRMLGWPVPGNAVTAQSSKRWAQTGDAETVIKNLIDANADRLGIPLTVAANGNRGEDITVESRMDTVGDVLIPVLKGANGGLGAGVGITVRQSGTEKQGTGFTLDVYEERAHPRTITRESGLVQSGRLSKAAPAATRTVIGGPGEGTLRKYRTFVETAAESVWADTAETFTNASDVDDDASLTANLTDRGRVAVAEGAARVGLSLSLAAGSTLVYDPTGVRGIRVGDRIPLQITPTFNVTETLVECSLSWSAGNGVLIAPVVGTHEESDDPLHFVTLAVNRALRSIQRLASRR